MNGKVFLFLFKNNLLLCYKIKIFIYICIANLSYAAQSACALKVNNHRLRPVRQRSHSGKKMAQRPTFWSKSNKLLRTMDAPYHELLLAAAGSELGFNSLIQRFSSMLYSHAYGILGNKEMAEEVVSDVFFETWKRSTMCAVGCVGRYIAKPLTTCGARNGGEIPSVWIISACKISCFPRCVRLATRSFPARI